MDDDNDKSAAATQNILLWTPAQPFMCCRQLQQNLVCMRPT